MNIANTLFGFVGPILRGVATPILDVAGKAVSAVADISDKKPKSSGGVVAVVLGWLGLTGGDVAAIGKAIEAVGKWLQ